MPLLHKGAHLVRLVIIVTQNSQLGKTVDDFTSLRRLHITVRYDSKPVGRKLPVLLGSS